MKSCMIFNLYVRALLVIILLVCASIALSGCAEKTAAVKNEQLAAKTEIIDGYNTRIIMPAQWINDVCEFDYSNNSKDLAKEFVNIIAPYNLIEERFTTRYEVFQYEDAAQWYINCLIASIDEEPGPEITAILGMTDEVYQALLVFKKIESDWYLIYFEPFFMKYAPPVLFIANNYGQNKTIFLSQVHKTGTGVFQDAFHFYKLIDGAVYNCLEIVNESRISGCQLPLEQDIKAVFEFHGNTTDEIWVTYDYHFFAGKDELLNGESDITFVKAVHPINYIWDSDEKKYKPDNKGDNPNTLADEKIMCFWEFGNDELFINAFDYEIKTILEKSAEGEKIALKRYLENYKESGAASPYYSYLTEFDPAMFEQPIPLKFTDIELMKQELPKFDKGNISISKTEFRIYWRK